MVDLYNWNTKMIQYEDKKGLQIELDLRGRIIVVDGDSGTGKSYLCQIIRTIQESFGNSEYNVDNIVLINKMNKSSLRDYNNKLIIIDRAELLLNEDDTNYITMDGRNRYLIFARYPIGLGISPNYFAKMIRDNKKLYLEYYIFAEGWR